MDATSHYEKFWNNQDKSDFISYERNLVLPELFSEGGNRVLDVGCGDGVVSEYLQNKLNLDVIGVDISENALKVARKRGIKAIKIDEEKKLPFESSTFDYVFWGDNIEHLFDPQKTLNEIRRVLKNNGKLILSCPNMGFWRYRIYFLLNGSIPDTEWSGNSPWYWSHIRFFNLNILGNFLESNGFKISVKLGVNKLFPEKLLAKVFPNLFSMILVIKAIKNG